MTPDDVWLDLGLALYRRRIELGIHSQRELAKRAGLHHNTIGKLERGEPWIQRGRSWAKVEAVLELPDGWIAEFVARHTSVAVLSAEVVEQTVLDAVTEFAPHVTVRQARAIAAATARRLEQQGLLPRRAGRG